MTLTLEERVQRGQGADLLLRDETAQMALAEMAKALHEALERIQTDDVDQTMAITRQLRALRQFKVKLEHYEQDGRHAALELERIKERGSNARI